MKTQVMQVTPEIAAQWLCRNIKNRPLRPAVVEGLVSAIQRGEWKLSHQGVAFARDGTLLDGQHRLTAIVQAERAVPLTVTFDAPAESFDVLDVGVKRTLSDVLSETKEIVAVGRFMAALDNPSLRGLSLTGQFVSGYIELVRPIYDDLVAFCPTAVRTWSSAPIRCGAIVQMMAGEDQDYIKLVYHALVHRKIEQMPPVARSLFYQQLDGKTKMGNDLFVRSLRVFTPSAAENTKVQVKNTSHLLTYARDVIARYRNVVGAPKKIPAAPVASGAGRSVKPSLKSITA